MSSSLHDWTQVPTLLEKYARAGGAVARALRAKLKDLPAGMGYGQVWYNPEDKRVWVSVGDWEEDFDAWKKPLESVAGVKDVRIEAECSPPKTEPWMLIKKAYSTTLHALGQLANFVPGPTNAFLGGPSPLAATLAGGLLGAGLGYGTGTLGEAFLPEEQFRPGRLRRTLALLGGALGAAPGAWWGTVNQREHPQQPGAAAWLSSWPTHPENLKKSALAEAYQALHDYLPPASARLKQAAAAFDTGLDVLNQIPVIPRDQFSGVVQQDLYTPPPVRAATVGLVDSASALRGGSPWVTPGDVARVAIGAGSGYVSGMLAGKTLGALAGLRPDTQQQLQRMGTWAGVLSAVVPLIFTR